MNGWWFLLGVVLCPLPAGVLTFVAVQQSPYGIPHWYPFVLIASFLLGAIIFMLGFEMSKPNSQRFRLTMPNGHNHFDSKHCPIDCPKNPYY